jgi:hypothetical protein
MAGRTHVRHAFCASCVLLIVLSSFGCSEVPSNQAEWSDKSAKFTLRVTEETTDAMFIAEITITNKTDQVLSFPTPMVMPSCGETNKNNIRVYDASGNRLEMTGLHADFFGRPASEIPAHSSRSWQFPLDYSFPDMSKPGTYWVELWYFADKDDETAWQGRVSMSCVRVIRVSKRH